MRRGRPRPTDLDRADECGLSNGAWAMPVTDWWAIVVSTWMLIGSGIASGAAAQAPALPDSLESAYRVDASRLALRGIERSLPLRDASIEIPPEEVRARLQAFAWLFHATGLAARDSVVDVFHIHTFPRPAVRELVLSLDATEEWVARWTPGAAPSGNSVLDELVRRYGLSLVSDRMTGAYRQVVLRSVYAVNMHALAARLAELPGVRWAESNTVRGDGSDIESERDGNDWLITFRLGWNDCPARCIESHYWRFRVTDRGAVTFLESWGSRVLDRNRLGHGT